MKVENIMTRLTKSCSPGTSVAEAAKMMWDGDFGFLPVVEAGKPVGVLTDRDICIGVATQDSLAAQIPAAKVMSRKLHTCRADDRLSDALKTMATHRVRRLPVLGKQGELRGVLSINDVLQEMKPKSAKTDAPDADQVMETLKSIGRHRDLPMTAGM